MLDHLEDHIRRVIADIRPQMLEKVIENWTSRLDYIRASRGSPMPEIIFKIYVYAHQKTARKTRTRLKRHSTTPVSSFFVWCTRITAFLNVALTREDKVMVTALTVHITNVIAPYE
ncbi:hypothetical protein TNCV_4970881 [Trichonephila clavipes]|nr:hypothetical protein TNCV_4970881 [Trichonephila clavipes]